jgi:hypothetical protein
MAIVPTPIVFDCRLRAMSGAFLYLFDLEEEEVERLTGDSLTYPLAGQWVEDAKGELFFLYGFRLWRYHHSHFQQKAAYGGAWFTLLRKRGTPYREMAQRHSHRIARLFGRDAVCEFLMSHGYSHHQVLEAMKTPRCVVEEGLFETENSS